MKRMKRAFAVGVMSLLAVGSVPALQGVASAGGSNQCSAINNSNNLCVINFNNVKVVVVGDRNLSDNEINIIRDVTIKNISVQGFCNADDKSSVRDCIDIIVKDVTAVVQAFSNFNEKKVCGKHKQTGYKRCKYFS
ncbi:MAG TPA: hypothetical protein VK988_05735 [Acidimicrobiales bacterium]|nr:hypothetical protein [Acidimicrobiales bacterium]